MGVTFHAQDSDMVFVKGGWFTIGIDSGSFDEQPAHKVFINDYSIVKYKVTNKQYCDFLNSKGNQIEYGKNWLDMDFSSCRIELVDDIYRPKKGFDEHPVIKEFNFVINHLNQVLS